ncbi:1,4-alpha-glucan branching protein GlgB [Gordonia sp. PP30]|uniref:1,4-alpha-glucan branching protein GlgB n=1 Tax=unclassified Gordonia (in: high G+C Gram-positive bacteria) TaxID=2657482 RepID=UPI0020004F4C|nr:1,4-alpha-glucan branching protein GlgB [Gordonia sp. PP30]UQE75462.1 1,4-alpha-glucan branching protein GlgB [Gordonia sp. PP30]
MDHHSRPVVPLGEDTLAQILGDAEAHLLVQGRHRDPFAVLGPTDDGRYVVVHVPGARRVWIVNDTDEAEATRHPAADGVFVGPFLPFYRLRVERADGTLVEREDPYRFSPVLGAIDEHLIGEGNHRRLWRVLGAHPTVHDEVAGVHFAVWAPEAEQVAVVGDFNDWNPTAHPMRRRGATGVWELFVPGIGEGEVYKYHLIGPGGRAMPMKADPVGFGAELPPRTGSVVRRLGTHHWHDRAWLSDRSRRNAVDAPISIYEVHLGSWRRDDEGDPPSYPELATELIDYVAELGFTHIEVLPISEHPFDGSWGYQPIGLFAPTIRYGTGAEFAALVDAAHARGIGVLADWVPGHFPTDQHGLGRLDGTALYEHANPQEGFHPDWNTLIFNYGRPEVANYLIANALYWLDEYHLDGLRVDAVASMLYRDYSRGPGEWVPNKDGGRENYEAIAFLRKANAAAYAEHPGVMMVAEESTTFPRVTGRVDDGGLGFGFKWNLGWMNDSLTYFGKDPVHRRYHHDNLTFGITYAFTENFVLPISHDEVVHGKGSMYGRMPGSHADKLGNLKAFYGYMWGYPGKKLLFMGQEFGQPAEWNHDAQLDWAVLADPGHAGVRDVVRDLNRLYREQPALHRYDSDPRGFQWLLVDAVDEQVFAWLRRGADGDPHVVVVLNLTPVQRTGFRLGFPVPGRWIEALNTDSALYAGGDRGNTGAIETEPVPAQREAQSALLTLPPLSALYFVEERTV